MFSHSHELVMGLVPVVQLCMLDCGASLDEARRLMEASLGALDNECWSSVCRQTCGNSTAHGEHDRASEVRRVLAPHRESFPSVVLASLQKVLETADEHHRARHMTSFVRLLSTVALTSAQRSALVVLIEEQWPAVGAGRQEVMSLLQQQRWTALLAS
jgi:hypothetical protein